MTNKKFSLVDFKGARQLSREEMKKIGGGIGGNCAPVGANCQNAEDCCSDYCQSGRCVNGGDRTRCQTSADCPAKTITDSCGTAHDNVAGRCYADAGSTTRYCHYSVGC